MLKMFGREQMCDPGNTIDNSTAIYLCGWEHIIPLKHRLSWQAGSSFCEENITSILLSGQSGGQGVLIRLTK